MASHAILRSTGQRPRPWDVKSVYMGEREWIRWEHCYLLTRPAAKQRRRYCASRYHAMQSVHRENNWCWHSICLHLQQLRSWAWHSAV